MLTQIFTQTFSSINDKGNLDIIEYLPAFMAALCLAHGFTQAIEAISLLRYNVDKALSGKIMPNLQQPPSPAIYHSPLWFYLTQLPSFSTILLVFSIPMSVQASTQAVCHINP
jgi:hypothetical protein